MIDNPECSLYHHLVLMRSHSWPMLVFFPTPAESPLCFRLCLLAMSLPAFTEYESASVRSAQPSGVNQKFPARPPRKPMEGYSRRASKHSMEIWKNEVFR
jgi:hypothetical protein